MRNTTDLIQEAFEAEIAASGGTCRDVWNDGSRLFMRSVLPGEQEVRPGDPLQGGVALRFAGGLAQIHPYVYRQVCTNGAIMAQTIETRRVALRDYPDPWKAIEVIRNAVYSCAQPDVLSSSTRRIRKSANTEADMALSMLPMLLRSSAILPGRVRSAIAERFLGESDSSLFGLMNAATSLARDTEDPGEKWDLEELGGAIPLINRPSPRLYDALDEPEVRDIERELVAA